MADARPKGETGYRRAKDLAQRMLQRRGLLVVVTDYLNQAKQETNADSGCIVVPKPGRDRYDVLVATDPSGMLISHSFIEHAMNLEQTLLTEHPFATMHGKRDSYELKSETLMTFDKLSAALVAPMFDEGGDLMAALVLYKRLKPPFSVVDRRTVETVAGTCAAILQNEPGFKRPPRTEDPLFHIEGLIGTSSVFKEACRRIGRFALSPYAVLLRGESGTGKTLVAREIHRLSRRKGPFVDYNVAGMPPDMLADALFGHEKDAFTGANRKSLGKFGEAEHGTLFLDEFADAPPDVQTMFLTAIEQKIIQPVGGQNRTVDVRIIVATNKCLEKLIREGKFRNDLLRRVQMCEITLPSLREHPEDIPQIAEYLLKRIAQEMHESLVAIGEAKGPTPPPRQLSRDAIDKLKAYAWPNNVRELDNCLKRACLLWDDQVLEAAQLEFFESSVEDHLSPVERMLAPQESIEDKYTEAVRALRNAPGETDKEKRFNAAAALGIHEKTLARRLRRGIIGVEPDHSLEPE